MFEKFVKRISIDIFILICIIIVKKEQTYSVEIIDKEIRKKVIIVILQRFLGPRRRVRGELILRYWASHTDAKEYYFFILNVIRDE